MAIGVSQAFKDAMQAPVKVLRATITAGTEVFTSSDVLVNFSLESSGYYFGAVTKVLDFSLLGTAYNLVGDTIHVSLEVQTDASNDTWATCDLGNFYVHEQDAKLEKETTSFKAYDMVGVLANTPYAIGGLTFPCTIGDLANQIHEKFGFAFEPSTLVNGSHQISEDLYAKINNITYRDILAEIAGATATIAAVSGSEDVLTFRAPEMTTTEGWTYDNLKSIKFEPKYGKVSSVVLSRMPQEDNIVVTDEDTEHSPRGKNLFNKETDKKFYGYFEGDKAETKIVTAGGGRNYTVYIPCSPNTTYTISNTVKNTKLNMYQFGTTSVVPANGIDVVGLGANYQSNTGVSKTLTTPNDAVFLLVRFQSLPSEDSKAVYDELKETFQIEQSESQTEYEPFVENGIVSVKLANNELLDDDRESMAQPILDAIKGFDFYPFEANTEGHGWHECGDRISVTDGTNTWDVIVTYTKLTIDGGIKELIRGVRPTEEQTNYALAGGIMKTIYNTEIKVDKQGQEITSIVSRQDSFENQTLENFSQVVQNINSVTTTIQTTGGGNLIHNSVGYNINTDKTLVNWTQTGTVSSESSPESLSYGAISGSQINLKATSSIIQRITVDSSGTQLYTLGFKAKKGATGVATIHLRNEIDDYTVTIPEGAAILWKNFSIVGVEPHASYFDVVIETNNAVTDFSITDLMLSVGDSTTPWVSASDEILSKNVAVDSSGVTVRSNNTNDYTQLNELGLNGYSDASGTMKNVFTVNRDTTEVEKFKSRAQISMPPIKIIPITSGNRAGWSFVKES